MSLTLAAVQSAAMARGFTLESLAETAGLPPSTLASSRLTVDTLDRIAQALGMNASDFARSAP